MDQRSNAHLAVRSPHKHRRMVAAASLALVVVIAAVVATVVHAGSTPVAKGSVRSSRHGSASHSGKRRDAAAQPATFLGSDGVEARWVIAENNRPGTTAWKIPLGTPANQIQGFANLNYAAAGQTVQLYVSTPSPTFRVVAYRMGWYRRDRCTKGLVVIRGGRPPATGLPPHDRRQHGQLRQLDSFAVHAGDRCLRPG